MRTLYLTFIAAVACASAPAAGIDRQVRVALSVPAPGLPTISSCGLIVWRDAGSGAGESGGSAGDSEEG